MSRRKHGNATAELAETKIMMYEKGSSGLKEFSGFVTEAYNSALYWPRVQPIYSRLRRSMPEMVVVRQAFSSWARNVKIRVDLPENPTDDDRAYQEFIETTFAEMEGGFGSFIDTVINNVPFYGWGWFTVVPGRRDPDFKAPDGDPWKPESDDGLIGLRRLAWRDTSSFYKWEMEDNTKRLLGMWQLDMPNLQTLLPLEESLHLTFGDPNNPEGLTPLEAVYRLERIKYGLEVINGIGFEHAAGYVNVKKTEAGQLSSADLTLIANAAKAILTGQQGNYAAWPFGIDGEVKDISFAAGPALLAAIQYYGVLALSCYTMQWIALSATTGSGSYAAMTDSSSMGVFTFNSMLDGFASQLDAQVGKRLYEWNKASFPNLTKRPTLAFTHIDKEIALNELSQFVSQISSVIKLGPDDIKAIREHIPFLPDTPGQDQSETDRPAATPEQIAQQTSDTIQAAMNVYRANKRAEMSNND
jgi:hypothetical protein